jgi:hypothetical protein
MTSINLGDTGVATSSAGAATVNHSSGVITTEALTGATQTTYVFTLTNNCIYAASQVMAQLTTGAGPGAWVVQSVVITAGQAVITFRNTSGSTSAGAGTLMFLVC